MDGASKFVRGDAIAGVLILLINIVGGLLVGTTQNGLEFGEAAEIYVLLTIGDGLVAQVPSLLLSLSTAIIVTRVTTSETTATQTGGQLTNPSCAQNYSCNSYSHGAGTWHAPLHVFIIGNRTWHLRLLNDRARQSVKDAEKRFERSRKPDDTDLDWEDIEHVDAIGLEIGYGNPLGERK